MIHQQIASVILVQIVLLLIQLELAVATQESTVAARL